MQRDKSSSLHHSNLKAPAYMLNMKLLNAFPIAMTIAQAIGSVIRDAPLQALVYRGPASCEGCPESVGALLESSPTNINVTYVGPNEDVDITAESLSQADIYAHPGGGSKSGIHPLSGSHS